MNRIQGLKFLAGAADKEIAIEIAWKEVKDSITKIPGMEARICAADRFGLQTSLRKKLMNQGGL